MTKFHKRKGMPATGRFQKLAELSYQGVMPPGNTPRLYGSSHVILTCILCRIMNSTR